MQGAGCNLCMYLQVPRSIPGVWFLVLRSAPLPWAVCWSCWSGLTNWLCLLRLGMVWWRLLWTGFGTAYRSRCCVVLVRTGLSLDYTSYILILSGSWNAFSVYSYRFWLCRVLFSASVVIFSWYLVHVRGTLASTQTWDLPALCILGRLTSKWREAKS